ncbi:potassium/proton antiporter [Pannonibacter tanglangensis]|uniref:Potassium/proton antiporter n=1 Tax=Pannonibacter tanglangensis TaxID=2750084 RepID=A0ABW9ZLX6_9HYPH|nr:potassium/proton antiporter [Pannonibacter sp. XCT-34]NBN65281.1 potassium/proton antiporter [Pannonibacter sp. XCT-34]
MVDLLFPVTLIGAGLVLVSVMTSALAFRFGAPLLLVFLSVGLLAGEDGLGIHYNDAGSAYFIGSLALAIILFDSGFNTRMRSIRQAAAPALMLATVGVLLTAGLVGVAAHFLFGLPWLEAFLLGAIVGSTDAAAVFFLLRVGGITIRDQVRSLLEVESGSNDPMAIFLTIILVELILSGGSQENAWLEMLKGFGIQMGFGLLFGLFGGYVVLAGAKVIRLEGTLYPISILSFALVLFGLTGMIGGSGFLAVYVAGIVAANNQLQGQVSLRRFLEGLTWMAQIAMFLTLGLLATPSNFLAIAVPAVLLALVLTFVCRPLAVWLCLLPFGYKRNETAFISWVGLRGSVSILLGIIPLAGGMENGQLLFNTAYIVVLVSLMLQGWTIAPMARKLGLIVPARMGPVERLELELPGGGDHELVVYKVAAESPVALGDERLPRWARPSLVVRDGHSMRYQYAGRLQTDDLVYMFVAPQYIRLLDRLFASPVRLTLDDEDFYGKFVIDPHQPMSALAEAYGLSGLVDPAQPPVSIRDHMTERLGGTAEVGDRISCGEVELIVRDLDADGAISEVGLSIEETEKTPNLPLFQSGRELWQLLRARLASKGGQG